MSLRNSNGLKGSIIYKTESEKLMAVVEDKIPYGKAKLERGYVIIKRNVYNKRADKMSLALNR